MEGLKRIGTRDPDGATSCRVSGEPANVLEKKKLQGCIGLLRQSIWHQAIWKTGRMGTATMQARGTKGRTVRHKGRGNKRDTAGQSVSVRAKERRAQNTPGR